MYCIVSPHLSINMLYLPLFCRGFAYTTLSIVFMASLCEVMDFNHFFQGLSIFNMIHMVIGGCLGCAVYAKVFGHSYMLPWRFVGKMLKHYYGLGK